MILIDSNALIILLLGLIDKNLIGSHKTSSIYTQDDFEQLVSVIQDFRKLIVLPQVWAEADNLLNNFKGNYKYSYLLQLKRLIEQSTERHIATKALMESNYLWEVGITDALILEVAKDCDYVITSDSHLSDILEANRIPVYDMVRVRNEKFR